MLKCCGIGGLSISAIIQRIDECLIPDDREPLLNYLEMMEQKLAGFSKKKATVFFHNSNGTVVMLKIMKRMISDEVPLRMIINIFDLQKRNLPIILDFLKYGGLELLIRIIEDHAEDIFLMTQAPSFKAYVLAAGSQASIEEIRHEGLALQLCRRCQETVERARRVNSSSTATKIPKSSERVNRVLMFMDNYPDKAPVISAGLDALIFFARNADSKDSVGETTMIASLCNFIPNFKDNADIIWRSFLCLHQACMVKVELAVEILRYNIHELVAELYPLFEDCRVKQQMLWLFDIFVSYSRTQVRIHISPPCMGLVKLLVESRNHLISSTGTSVKDKYEPYKVVVPLSIRQFFRETKGQVLPVAPEKEAEQQVYAPRKKFGKDPIYGRAHDVHFPEGESGLVD